LKSLITISHFLSGKLSVAVPGEILAMYNAWKTQGRLPWKRLFQPTIDLANNGFVIDEPLAKVIKSTAKDIIKEKGFKYVHFQLNFPLATFARGSGEKSDLIGWR
jgi:gamma-glutamyltranspeptidase